MQVFGAVLYISCLCDTGVVGNFECWHGRMKVEIYVGLQCGDFVLFSLILNDDYKVFCGANSFDIIIFYSCTCPAFSFLNSLAHGIIFNIMIKCFSLVYLCQIMVMVDLQFWTLIDRQTKNEEKGNYNLDFNITYSSWTSCSYMDSCSLYLLFPASFLFHGN